jgi:hypothetical protein
MRRRLELHSRALFELRGRSRVDNNFHNGVSQTTS